MALAHWQETFTDVAGNIRAGLLVTIRNEATGAIAALFTDSSGGTGKTNPLTTDDFGFADFYAAPGRYRVQSDSLDRRNVEIVSFEVTTSTGTQPLDEALNQRVSTFPTVAALQAASLPAGVSVSTQGDIAAGDGGNGEWFIVAGSSASSNHRRLLANGNTAAFRSGVLLSGTTVRVPTDCSTLQEACDLVQHWGAGQGSLITVLIETGHALTSGLTLKNSDFSHVILASTDSTVGLDPLFAGNIFIFTSCRAPIFDLAIDGTGALLVGRGMYYNYNCTGRITAGSGVSNLTPTDTSADNGKGILVESACVIDARNAEFNGNKNRNVHVSKGSTFDMAGGTANNCLASDTSIWISRGSTFVFDGGQSNNNAGAGLVVLRSVATLTPFTGTNTEIKNNGGTNILITDCSRVFAGERSGVFVDATGGGDGGIDAQGASIVDAKQISVTGYTNFGIKSQEASTINALSATAQKAGSDTATDVIVASGGTVSFFNGSGGTSQAANSYSKDGLIIKNDIKSYLNGELDLNGNNITGNGGLALTGSVHSLSGATSVQLQLYELDRTDEHTVLSNSGGDFLIRTLSDAGSGLSTRFLIDHSTGEAYFEKALRNGSKAGPLWVSGTGTPEGVITAPVGSFFSRTDGGAVTSFYVKESGTGNTGWVAK